MKHTVSYIVLASLTLFMACRKPAKENISTNNSNFQVELLFEVDSCKVYRFMDSGVWHYFTTCQGSVGHVDKHGDHTIETTIEKR